MAAQPAKVRSPERRVERLRNRAERRWAKWKRALATRVSRDREELRKRIEDIRASLVATEVSERGLGFIGSHEGLRLTAYKPVPAEPYWTIGFGHFGPDVRPGMTITKERAYELLRLDAAEAARAVREGVEVKLAQHEADALISFAFNVGTGAFASSTLLRKLNAGDRAGAAAEFGRWVNGASGPLPGLVNRRREERELFLHGDYST